MKLLCTGGVGEESHTKDALSRVVVEMVKREWPQQWATLLSELSEACAHGPTQTELVLLVLLRLVEDVALLQTLESNQRRKDIYQALTTNMAVIFEFFLRLIELHVGAFRAGGAEAAQAHGRVVHTALLALAGFVEWVSIAHVTARDGRLLHVLCLLLVDASFRCAAAECLAQIVNRRGRPDERLPLLCLLGDDASRCLLAAARSPDSPALADEPAYLFKKKLVAVVSGLGWQICSLWGKEGGVSARPPNLPAFLDALLAFSEHPSLTVAHLANPTWAALMRHEHASRDAVFLAYVPRWLHCTAPKILRRAYAEDAYARLEHDCEEEAAQSFYRCRTDLLDTFRQATVAAPLVTFGYVERWLTRSLTAPPTPTTPAERDAHIIEWEALANVVDSVLGRLLQAQERPPTTAGLRLLELCLAFEPADPLVLSTLLTCISALFVFLSMSSGQMAPAANPVAASGAALLPRVLDKIFGVLTAPSSTKESRPRAVKNVRRHAASLMVKIGHKYPLLLLPVFEQIGATVATLERQTGGAQLSTLERVTLKEALLLISNHLCDYERQTAFVGETMAEAAAHWHDLARRGALSDAARFVSLVGLDTPSTVAGDADARGIDRSRLVLAVNLLVGVVKRCAWPDDPERAVRGGFVVGLTESGNPVCRNPATPHVVPLLPHLLDLMRTFNELHGPEARRLLVPEFAGCVDAMLDVERSNLLGVQSPSSSTDGDTQQTPAERMQRCLGHLHEACYHTLGAAGPALGRDLYQLPGLGQALVDSVLSRLQLVPDHRLRPIARVFLKPFVHACPPPFYEPVLLPLIAQLAPLMAARLAAKWQRVAELRDAGAPDEHELLEDMMTRVLTREYLDVIRVALVGGAVAGPDADTDAGELMDAPPPPSRQSLAVEVVSELGALLLRDERTCQPLVVTVMGALSWIDSNASIKATALAGPVVRLLLNDGSLTGEMASHVMLSILHALALHGQHESNQGTLLTLGAHLYALMRPLFPDVLHVMQQIPCVNPLDLQKLDERISAAATTKGKVEKVKKDLFKKIIGPVSANRIESNIRTKSSYTNS